MIDGELEPDELLKAFVESLPDLIRDSVKTQCCFAFGRILDTVPLGQEAVFQSLFDIKGPRERAYRCAQIAASLELALEPDKSNEQLSAALAAKHDYAPFRVGAAQEPLKRKFREQAQIKLYELRDGPLSSQSLLLWSVHLLQRNPLPRPRV